MVFHTNSTGRQWRAHWAMVLAAGLVMVPHVAARAQQEQDPAQTPADSGIESQAPGAGRSESTKDVRKAAGKEGFLPSGKSAAPQRLDELLKGDKTPPTILHEPVRSAASGGDLRISANILDNSGVKNARLFYKPYEDEQYKMVQMDRGVDGLFHAIIPQDQTRINQIAYYLEASDLKNNGPASLGTPELPFVIILHAATNAAKGNRSEQLLVSLGVLLLGTFSMFAALHLLAMKERKHQVRIKVDQFWERKLSPLLELSPEEISRKVQELSTTPMMHPGEGMKVFPRDVILSKLRWLHQLHPKAHVYARLKAEDVEKYKSLVNKIIAIASDKPSKKT